MAFFYGESEMYIKKISCIILGLLVSGCAGDLERFQQGYPLLKGKNIKEVVAYLGTPDTEQTIMGKKVYEWRNTSYGVSSSPVMQNATFTTYGATGPVTTYGTTMGHVTGTSEYQCTLKVVTEKNGVISESTYNGAPGGCSKYGPAIESLTQPEKAGKV